MEATIVIDILRLPYTYEEQELNFKAIFKGNLAITYLSSDSNYRADVALRSFTISKSVFTIEVRSTNNKVYDGNAYEVETIVKDKDGKIVENPTVKYTYYKGIRKLSAALTEVGSYTVIATYSGGDAYYGSTVSMKFNISK